MVGMRKEPISPGNTLESTAADMARCYLRVVINIATDKKIPLTFSKDSVPIYYSLLQK